MRSCERETCLKVHLDYRCGVLPHLSLSVLRFLLPVCTCRAWSGVCSLPSASQRERSGALEHRSTGTPVESRPAPSAPHIVGGLDLLSPGMTHSKTHTNTHVDQKQSVNITWSLWSHRKANTNTLFLNWQELALFRRDMPQIRNLIKIDSHVIKS